MTRFVLFLSVVIAACSICISITYADTTPLNWQKVDIVEFTDDTIILYCTLSLDIPLPDAFKHMIIVLSRQDYELVTNYMVDDIPCCKDEKYWYCDSKRLIDLKLPLAPEDQIGYARLYTEEMDAILIRNGMGPRPPVMLADYTLILFYSIDSVRPYSSSVVYPRIENGIPTMEVFELPASYDRLGPISCFDTGENLYMYNAKDPEFIEDDLFMKIQFLKYNTADQTTYLIDTLVNLVPVTIANDLVYCRCFNGPGERSSILQIRNMQNFDEVIFEMDLREYAGHRIGNTIIPISDDEVLVSGKENICIVNTSTREVKQVYNFEEEYYKLHAGD
jgi:hypothetical protein